MDCVITFIGSKDRPLSQLFVDTMAASLRGQGIAVGRIEKLAEGIAYDMHIRSADMVAVDAYIQMLLGDQPFDAITQPMAGRRKKMLISDMDSTMITVECIDELADFVGKKKEVAAITERAMNGELDFAAALRQRVALLKGLPEVILLECYDERVKMMQGAHELVATMRQPGAHCLLVSGGFNFFTSRVRIELGFHEDYANQLEIDNGVLSGKVILPILGKEAKLQALLQTCEKLQIDASEVLAVGDGANDLPMLLAAGLGVAYHAKPMVRKQASARINHSDLSALLYVQGLYPLK